MAVQRSKVSDQTRHSLSKQRRSISGAGSSSLSSNVACMTFSARSAGIQNAKVFRRKMLEAVTPGAQIVQQNDVGDAEDLNEIRSLDNPRKIGGTHAAVDDRAGNAESGGNDVLAAKMLSGLAREFLDDALELREFFSGEALPENQRQVAAFFRK